MTKHAAAQTRQRLIEATSALLRQHGVVGLTLDAVARAATVSKGGLLHHFASKDALIEAVLTQLLEDFTHQVEGYAAQERGRPGAWLRAYVRATFEDQPLPLEVVTLLLTAVTESAPLMELVQRDAQAWQERLLADQVPAARATVVRMAADAYWSERVIGTAPATPAERTALRDELLRLIDEVR